MIVSDCWWNRINCFDFLPPTGNVSSQSWLSEICFSILLSRALYIFFYWAFRLVLVSLVFLSWIVLLCSHSRFHPLRYVLGALRGVQRPFGGFSTTDSSFVLLNLFYIIINLIYLERNEIERVPRLPQSSAPSIRDSVLAVDLMLLSDRWVR